MKTRYLLFWAWILGGFCPPVLCSEISKATLISLIVLRQERQQARQEVLLIGQYVDGRYERITDSDVQRLLKRHRAYTAFRRGKVLGEVTIDSLVVVDFACDELLVGVGRSTILRDEVLSLPLDEAMSGIKSGQQFSYTIQAVIGLNNDAAAITTQQHAVPLRVSLSDQQGTDLLTQAISALQTKQTIWISTGGGDHEGYLPADLPLARVEKRAFSFDLDGDGVIEHLIIGAAENEEGQYSMFVVGQVQANKPIPLLIGGFQNSPSSWGRGYELLDVLDIDGDEIPELIFKVSGYEWTGYEIYRFANGRFQKVLEMYAYGC